MVSKSHPVIKRVPPRGVIGPSQLADNPVIGLVLKRYRDPEKSNIPNPKHQAIALIMRLGPSCFTKMASASSARV
jgi:hypothetical protein